MIERVAKAICWKHGMNPDVSLGGDGQNFLWMEYEPAARAAIEAMREPSEGMFQGALAAHVSFLVGDDRSPNDVFTDEAITNARAAFHRAHVSAIDAALQETKG
ncbi:MAG: hypothetical protein P0Y66_22360 [Candidatus Kaistia colombiensis]|nr:MAG: hypothetical protein P0Y66_22360 [Kaistia sp.]